MKKYYLFLLLSFCYLTVKSQCLQVNIGVIIDTTASPCDGPVTLDAGHAGANFSWSTGESSQKIRVTTTNTYIVTVDKNGCIGTDTIKVTFTEPPFVDLGADFTTQCGGCITLDAGDDGSRYAWSNGGRTRTQKFCQPGTQTVWVDVFSTGGCKTSDTITFTIEPGLQVNLGDDTSICGGSLELDAGIASSYLWSTGATTRTITANSTGTYSVEVSDENGCLGMDTIAVEIKELPVIELGADPAPSCGGCVSLSATGGDYSYSWSTGETSNNIEYCREGTNKIFLTATNNAGCTATDSVNLTISPGPALDLGPDKRQCGGTVTLESNLNGSNYLWNNGSTSPSISTRTSGTFWLKIEDELGCKASDTVEVAINEIPAFNLGPDPESRCGGCFDLSASSPHAIQYQWSTGETSSSISYCRSGINKVWASALSADGCIFTDTISVNILPGYMVDLGKDTVKCGGPVTIATNFPNNNHLWNTGHTNNQITVSNSGIYSVKIFDLEGCSANDTIIGSKRVFFAPELAAPVSISDLSGNCPERVLNVSAVEGADGYVWTIPSDWKMISGDSAEVVKILPPSPEVTGKVSVYAINQYGCISAAKDTIAGTPDMKVFVPNAFTPNGDGINDEYVIRNIEFYPENEFTVLNRWGNEVYKKRNYKNEWRGSNLNEGTYFYRLNMRECETEKSYTGDITILR